VVTVVQQRTRPVPQVNLAAGAAGLVLGDAAGQRAARRQRAQRRRGGGAVGGGGAGGGAAPAAGGNATRRAVPAAGGNQRPQGAQRRFPSVVQSRGTSGTLETKL
jgi:hypothetical protein